ncbi:MAG: hypothetical protein OQL19_11080 [Gammaproteobacteria bacterium]|nr:hypothetical protein [Gammaproteobacteria bacterium]
MKLTINSPQNKWMHKDSGNVYIWGHHGEPGLADDRNGTKKRTFLGPNELEALLKDSGVWHKGKTVILMGCHTATDAVNNDLAQRLANQIDNPVAGTDNYLWLNPWNGNIDGVGDSLWYNPQRQDVNDPGNYRLRFPK